MADKNYSHQPVEAFVFEDWLRDGLKGIRESIQGCTKGAGQRRFDTSEFRMHMRNARKEQLLAIRSLIDSAIDCLNKKEEPDKHEA
jgi:hypothetical protein